MAADYKNAATQALASVFVFYQKAHVFHWNVTGPMFAQYHELFGKIWEDVFDSIDGFAERNRALQIFVPPDFQEVSMISYSTLEVAPVMDMVKELSEDNDKIISILKYAYDVLNKAGEYGYVNFLADRIDMHKKHGWMLKASLA